MQRLFILLLLAIIGINVNLVAESINIDTTITINNQERYIGFYAPKTISIIDTFDVVIVLHDDDETAIECRERVINELRWDTLFIKALFAFPDAGESKDYYKPLENKKVLDSTLRILNDRFPVKKRRKTMISSGLNSRAAMKYTYLNPNYFDGLILINPIMNGLNDVQNIEPTSLVYNYGSGKHVNTIILKNSIRNIYLDSLERRLMGNVNRAWSIESENLSSKYPNDSLMNEAIDYIIDPTAGDNDFAFKEIQMPLRICNLHIQPIVLAKHLKGSAFIFLSYSIADTASKNEFKPRVQSGYPFSLEFGFINSFANLFFNGPIKEGKTTLRFAIGERYNMPSYLDTIYKSIYYQPNTYSQPISMGFEKAEDLFDKYWFIKPSGDIKTWAIDTLSSSEGNNSLTMHNSKYQTENSGQTESFFTPFVDLTKLDYKSITFDYAFNYQKYGDAIYTDTLRVYITNDCDKTYELLYEASGADLATSIHPIIDPENEQETKYIPDSESWKRIEINLQQYKLEEKASFLFSIVSGMGGSTYIDNIRIGDAISNVDEISSTKFEIYPNPTNNSLTLELEESTDISIVDIKGNQVLNLPNFKGGLIDISNLTTGFYSITNNTGKLIGKFIKAD